MKFITDCTHTGYIDDLGCRPRYSEYQAALLNLMRRPWFTRRWIVQELARTKQAVVLCGKDEKQWQEFADAVAFFSFKQDDIRKIFREAPNFYHYSNYIGDVDELGAVVYVWNKILSKTADGKILQNRLSLEGLMSLLTVFEASDARDALYAILWITKDAKPCTKTAPKWDEDFEISYI